MKKSLVLVILVANYITINAQSLSVEIENVNEQITSPWNWDITSFQDQLIAVNERGTLNIKKNGSWETIEVVPGNTSIELRGVDVDDNGLIWITSTEHGLWSYDGNQFVNYNSDNSFLPTDDLRALDFNNQTMWVSTNGQGIIQHNFSTSETTLFNTSLISDLKSDFLLDPYVDESENVWFRNRECLTKLTPDLEWINEDMRTYISGGRVNDIHIVSETEIWLAMDGGVVLYDGNGYNVVINNQFDNYKEVLKDSKGNVWLSKNSTLNAEGITIISGNQEYFFSNEDYPNIPNQIFEFIEYQDTIIAVGTIGNSIAKFTVDGLTSSKDQKIESINIYPNPTHEYLLISDSNGIKISSWYLTSLAGIVVKKGIFASNKIDVSDLSEGTYVLNLYNKNEIIHTEKIIITNR